MRDSAVIINALTGNGKWKDKQFTNVMGTSGAAINYLLTSIFNRIAIVVVAHKYRHSDLEPQDASGTDWNVARTINMVKVRKELSGVYLGFCWSDNNAAKIGRAKVKRSFKGKVYATKVDRMRAAQINTNVFNRPFESYEETLPEFLNSIQ
jgi:hypothetical protein